jgi:hypothetical protein
MFEHWRAPAREVAVIDAGDAQNKKGPWRQAASRLGWRGR